MISGNPVFKTPGRYINKKIVLSFLFAVFLSQLRDSSKKGKQVDLHFDLSFCVPTSTTKNVNVKVKG